MNQNVINALSQLQDLSPQTTYGEVTKVRGLMVEIKGFGDDLTVGSRVTLCPKRKAKVLEKSKEKLMII